MSANNIPRVYNCVICRKTVKGALVENSSRRTSCAKLCNLFSNLAFHHLQFSQSEINKKKRPDSESTSCNGVVPEQKEILCCETCFPVVEAFCKMCQERDTFQAKINEHFQQIGTLMTRCEINSSTNNPSQRQVSDDEIQYGQTFRQKFLTEVIQRYSAFPWVKLPPKETATPINHQPPSSTTTVNNSSSSATNNPRQGRVHADNNATGRNVHNVVHVGHQSGSSNSNHVATSSDIRVNNCKSQDQSNLPRPTSIRNNQTNTENCNNKKNLVEDVPDPDTQNNQARKSTNHHRNISERRSCISRAKGTGANFKPWNDPHKQCANGTLNHHSHGSHHKNIYEGRTRGTESTSDHCKTRIDQQKIPHKQCQNGISNHHGGGAVARPHGVFVHPGQHCTVQSAHGDGQVNTAMTSEAINRHHKENGSIAFAISAASFNFSAVKCDPQVKLPPEIFELVLQYCSVQTLAKIRLVSKSWNTAAVREWRGKCVITLDGEWLKNKTIIPENCDVPVGMIHHAIQKHRIPFRNFKLENFPFNHRSKLNGYTLAQTFIRRCGPNITRLVLTDSDISDTYEFYWAFFEMLPNLKELVLLRPVKFFRIFSRNHGRLCRNARFKPNQTYPVKKNLTHLTIDFWGGIGNRSEVQYENGSFPVAPKLLLQNAPNLNTLKLFYKSPDLKFSHDISSILSATAELQPTNSLQHLKHLHIHYLNTGSNLQEKRRNFRSFVLTMTNLWQSKLKLETFQVEVNAPALNNYEPYSLDLAKNSVTTFGSTLKTLKLFTTTIFLTPAEFGSWKLMDNLEHLSISYWISESLLDAKYLRKLKTLEVLSEPEQTVNRDEVERVNKNCVEWIDLTFYKTVYKQSSMPVLYRIPHVNEDDSEDEEETLAGNARLCAQSRDQGFLFGGYKRLRGYPFLFDSVTKLRLEHSVSCEVFQKLPKWMPNVVVLEARIPACAFPVVCKKWDGLKKLTLLRRRNETVEYENYVSIGDVDLTGNTTYLTTSIKDLKDLEYFKVERPLTKYLESQIIFNDTSFWYGLIMLRKLKFLEIVAEMRPETIGQMFSRIPECTVYRLRRNYRSSQNQNPECHYYYGIQNYLPY